MNEKQIDELARMIRDYVGTGYRDMRLIDEHLEFIHSMEATPIETNSDLIDRTDISRYFLQSLRRELTEPEVVRRRYSHPHGFWQEETNYP